MKARLSEARMATIKKGIVDDGAKLLLAGCSKLPTLFQSKQSGQHHLWIGFRTSIMPIEGALLYVDVDTAAPTLDC